MKLPVIILSKNRPLQLNEMLDSLEPHLEKIDLIVCDNVSRQEWMSETWSRIEKIGTLIKNKKDQSFIGTNPGLALIGDSKYFILSDPDIVLNQCMPPDWIEIMSGILDKYSIPKIGLAMALPNPSRDQLAARVHGCEHRFWKMKYDFGIPDDCYVAPVDSTFCMYRRDTYDFWETYGIKFTREMFMNDCQIRQDIYNPKYDLVRGYFPTYTQNCIRIAGRFTAEHTGWSSDPKYDQENANYYMGCNKIMASTITWRKENGC